MQRVKNLTIIGTSHIAKESVDLVQKVILEEKPWVVAIELDRKRYEALLTNERRRLRLSDVKRLGVKGFLFNLLGAWAERKLGKMVGLPPGSEMKAAIASARQVRAAVALIDQDIAITLRRLSKTITMREKMRFAGEVIASVVWRKGRVEFDLQKVPSEEVIAKLTSKMKKKYPSLYQVLIKERDIAMAKGLYKILQDDRQGKVVAVIGAGHEKKVAEMIKKLTQKW